MTDLHKLLDWKLLSGSHEFPGPQGGTCINEAALVVAGFPYRRVRSVMDLPSCFSRPIANYAIKLNDRVDDEFRQKLIPFVVRLAGSADTLGVERQRVRMMVLRTVREIVAPAFDGIGLKDEAMSLRHCCWDDLIKFAYAACFAAMGEPVKCGLRSVAYAIEGTLAADMARSSASLTRSSTYAALSAFEAAVRADETEQKDIWTIQMSILDEALSIGKQAEPIDTALIVSRAAQAKVRSHQSEKVV